MYTSFYGLSEKPFGITPDPVFLYQTRSHREALSSMFYGIREKKGIISITGEVGTGKTTLIYSLLQRLDQKINTAFIYHTNVTFDQLLKKILTELKIDFAEADKIYLLQRLNDYLIEKHESDEITAVIIDEAQNLPDNVLEELRMLSNLETSHSKLLQLVLVGQPELEVKLNTENLRQLKQRISIRQQLMPLTFKESKEYILHRLQVAGGALNIFSNSALDKICTYANGIPRTINVVCDNTLLIGYSKSAKKINDDIINEVISDMEYIIPPGSESGNNFEPLKQLCVPQSGPTYYRAVILLCFLLIVLLSIAVTTLYLRQNDFLEKQVATSDITDTSSSDLISKPVYPEKKDPPVLSILNSKTGPYSVQASQNSNTVSIDKSSTVYDNTTQNISIGLRFDGGAVDNKTAVDMSANVSDQSNNHIRSASKNTAQGNLSEGAFLAYREPTHVLDTVIAQRGTTLFDLARQYYHSEDITYAYMIKKANPEIENIHQIKLNQHIIIPEINFETPLIKTVDNGYHIELGAFQSVDKVRKYFHEPLLYDKEIRIIPVKVSSTDIWYRVVLEKFETKEAGLSTILLLKEKGLLPCFNNSDTAEISS